MVSQESNIVWYSKIKKIKLEWLKHLYIFLGPPGSGKTTYSVFLSDFYGSLNRLSRYINLDCSNIQKHIINSIDFRRILLCEEIISELHIGPNSSIFFSIEYLCDNIEWLENEIESVIKKNRNRGLPYTTCCN